MYVYIYIYICMYTDCLFNTLLPLARKAQMCTRLHAKTAVVGYCRAVVSERLLQGPYTVTVTDEGRTHTLRVTGRKFQSIGHRASGQLWVSNLSKFARQWLAVDSNLQPSGYKST